MPATALPACSLPATAILPVPISGSASNRTCGPCPRAPERAELASALRESVVERTAQLAAQSPEFFAEIITRFDGARVTRLEMVQTIKEHELTHRSQLFMYLRLKGIVPATTRRRLAKQAGK